MTIEENIFKKVDIDLSKLEKYGFKKSAGSYIYEKLFKDDEFKAIITISPKFEISGKVIDVENNEEYLPLRFEHTESAYVGIVRAAYIEILEDIVAKCSIPKYFIYPQANRLMGLIFEKYVCKIDFPWDDYDGYGVFRNPDSNKWFALVMNIDKSKIDKTLSGEVEVVNIKLDKDEIQELLKQDGFYPAYHMNKKNWITITLDETLSDAEIMKYIDESYSYTVSKKKKRS